MNVKLELALLKLRISIMRGQLLEISERLGLYQTAEHLLNTTIMVECIDNDDRTGRHRT